MRVQLSIPQIEPVEITYPRNGDDEIYVAYSVSVAKPGLDDTPAQVRQLGGRVSDVKRGINRETGPWTPDPDGIPGVFDLPDGQVAAVTFALYEEDNSALHRQMQEESGIRDPDEAPWEDLDDTLGDMDIDDIPTDPIELALLLAKVGWKLTAYFIQDDLMGKVSHPIASTATADELGGPWAEPKRLTFEDWGGKYVVTAMLEEVS